MITYEKCNGCDKHFNKGRLIFWKGDYYCRDCLLKDRD